MTGKSVYSEVWLKAAVVGSSWASFEIIVGSFLHNLRLPFAGMLLSAASVLLLAAFIRLWPLRGLIIRAGLVCALMKSISPSALVFGPMIGITTEAMIMELVLLIFGRNLIAISLAGGLAVLWALAQKLLNLFVLYGFNLIEIAESFYAYLIKISGIKALSLVELFYVIVVIYLLLGMVAALAGSFIGKSYLKNGGVETKSIDLAKDVGFAGGQKNLQAQLMLLPVLLLSAAGVLLALNFRLYILALPAGFVFIVWIALRYRQAVRRLLKPAVWLQFLLITLVASLLLESANQGFGFSLKGMWLGAEMVFRAVLLIFSFTALAAELRNPVLKAVLQRHGLSRLYGATSLAFSALPALIGELPKWKDLLRNPQQLLWQVLGRSEQLLKQFSKENQAFNVVIITGEVHQGKTIFLSQLLDLMQQNNIAAKGFLARARFENDIQTGYDLHLFPSGTKLPLARTGTVDGWVGFRRFSFNPEAFAAGSALLRNSSSDSDCWLVVDELGPMELEGNGWHDTVSLLLTKEHMRMIWVVRKNFVPAMLTHFAAERVLTIDIGQHTADEALEMLK